MKRTPPVKKNDDISLSISGYTSEGAGIGRYKDFAVFVPGALEGETVEAHIIKVTASYAVGKLTSVTSPNKNIRALPSCPCYEKCGGCDLQHMTYSEQLRFKQNRVQNALSRLGGSDADVLPIIPAADKCRYRNKASFPFAEIDGNVRLGFFAPRSHRLVPIDDCAIQKEDISIALTAVAKWANKYGLSAYNEQTGDGILRHLVVRATTEGTLVTVVTNSSALPYSDKLKELLLQKYEQEDKKLVGIVHCINNTATNVILGSKYKTVYGKAEQTEQLCGLWFSVRVPSFLQVNHKQTEALYNIALDFLAAKADENIIDIYCGIGTITLKIAETAKHVTGIEYVKEAAEDAAFNAKKNKIDNVTFKAGAAEEILPELVSVGQSADSVLLDPPRSGCEGAVLKAIADSGAKRVVYVSCNPETLARDIKILSGYGYAVKKAQPVDMFPQTEHVETVVLLSRK